MPQQERSTSADRGSLDATKEWINVQDSEERRKIQNRVAQRKYRARVKRSSHNTKQADIDLTVPASNMYGVFEQHDQISSKSSSPILDQVFSQPADTPWLLDMISSQPLSPNIFPTSYDTDRPALLGDSDPPVPPSPASYEYPNMQFPYVNSYATPPNDAGNITHGTRGYKPHTVRARSPNAVVQANKLHQVYFKISTKSPKSPSKRRPEVQLPRRERRFSAKDTQNSNDRDDRPTMFMNSKGQSPGQPENDAKTGGPSKSRRDRRASKTDDSCNELTKACENAQKQLMQQAYQRGRAEAAASCEKQRSHLRKRAQTLMGGVIETWSLGVELELFGRDERFEKSLHSVQKGLGELALSAAECSVDVNGDGESSSRGSSESDAEDGRGRGGWS